MTSTTELHTLGKAQVAGPLAVFPIFGPDPELEYLAFAQAREHGAFVKELDSGASVGNLKVGNPTGSHVLIYEGEEVQGAQQNRTFDVSLLVKAGSDLTAPVSCIEAGRWDGSRAGERFRPAPQTAHPQLRTTKRYAANTRLAAGMDERADQGEVWREVDANLQRHGVESDSAALSDVYEGRRSDLAELSGIVEHVPGQAGAVALVSGAPVALDLVSRPDVFASLLPRLAQGYALDALGRAPASGGFRTAEAFLDAAIGAPRTPAATPGMGEGFTVRSRVAGSGLSHEGELVQMSAFPAPPDGADATVIRIARPSHRRR